MDKQKETERNMGWRYPCRIRRDEVLVDIVLDIHKISLPFLFNIHINSILNPDLLEFYLIYLHTYYIPIQRALVQQAGIASPEFRT